MRGAAGLAADSPGVVQEAIAHHFDSGGGRTRARIAIGTGNALHLEAADTVAIAAGAELLHNASLIHDDLQDMAEARRGAPSVWAKYGANIAICAGDLLVSAAYGALASGSGAARAAELTPVMHDATTRVINGQAKDLAAQLSDVTDIDSYKDIARGKSGPLLALPVELALTTAGFPNHIPIAREAAELLAVAYQIADDLEDEEFDAGAPGGGCLNAVAVLRRSGHDNPSEAARYEASLALRDAMRQAMYLPQESGQPIVRCIEAVRAKLKASS